MKKILVPTDFSINANKALDFAVEIAKKAKAEIIIIHTCGAEEVSFEDEANQNLLLIKKSIEDAEELTVKVRLYRSTVVESILQASGEQGIGLIIMGTLGKSGIKEKIFGSITAAIIGKSDVPVLAVPLLSEWAVPGKILLAINDFDEDPAVTARVFELTSLFNASLQVAVFTDVDTAVAIDYLKNEREIRAYEEKSQELHKGIDLKAFHLDGHRFMETIEDFIDENKIDIVSMVAHKRSIIESLFNRSLTKKMSYNTRIPLLALPG